MFRSFVTIRLLVLRTGLMNVITMSKEKQSTERFADGAAIHNTPELRSALIYTAIGLSFDRADAPHNANKAEDRTVGKVLVDLARQLGADL